MDPLVFAGRVASGDVHALLSRLADSRLAAQLQAAPRGTISDALLRDAEALRQAEVRMESLGITPTEFLQAGKESAVLGAGNHVIKLGLGRHGPYEVPEEVGILPYEYSEILGPLRIGVQERVPIVRPPETGQFSVDRAVDREWRAKADRVYDSLISRGILFKDPHGGNVGQYRDGRLVAIDGPFERVPIPSQRPFRTPEEAIRALLLQGQ